jgi:hypothetical protein
MTHVTALRNSVLCGIAVVAVAGCGGLRPSSVTPPAPPVTGVAASTGVAGAVPAATPVASPAATPDTSAINQQITGIDNQLSTIDGQINAANAGLSTSEGDPSQ